LRNILASPVASPVTSYAHPSRWMHPALGWMHLRALWDRGGVTVRAKEHQTMLGLTMLGLTNGSKAEADHPENENECSLGRELMSGAATRVEGEGLSWEPCRAGCRLMQERATMQKRAADAGARMAMQHALNA
jgi:hypothetical protein